MVADAYGNKYDVAPLITGDNDLVPAVQIIRLHFPGKRIISVFPPKRTNEDLRKVSSGVYHITESVVSKSLPPERTSKPDGYFLERPTQWH